MRRSSLTHKGMTLLELLTVISVVGVLVALLLVGVQAVRESSRKLSCANNLKQIGIAFQNYESTHRCLPAGIGPAGHSPLAAILPLIEMQAVYDQIDFSIDPFDSQEARDTTIPLYRCPSAQHLGVAPPARTDYGINRGTTLAEPRDDPWQFFERGYSRSSSFTQGSSNTALLSEILPKTSDDSPGASFYFSNQRDFIDETVVDDFVNQCRRLRYGTDPVSHFDNGLTWIGGGTENYYHILPPNANSCTNGTSVQDSLFTATSLHNGVNVLFADSHVQFFINETDEGLWREIGSR